MTEQPESIPADEDSLASMGITAAIAAIAMGAIAALVWITLPILGQGGLG